MPDISSTKKDPFTWARINGTVFSFSWGAVTFLSSIDCPLTNFSDEFPCSIPTSSRTFTPFRPIFPLTIDWKGGKKYQFFTIYFKHLIIIKVKIINVLISPNITTYQGMVCYYIFHIFVIYRNIAPLHLLLFVRLFLKSFCFLGHMMQNTRSIHSNYSIRNQLKI